MSFHEFQEKCSIQGLEYDPSKCSYSGDKYVCNNTCKFKKRRKALVLYLDGSIQQRLKGRPRTNTKIVDTVNYSQFSKKYKQNPRKSKLCRDLTRLLYHKSRVVKTKERVCAYCGKICTLRCFGCLGAPYLHHNVICGIHKNNKCFYHYHNNAAFGLAKNDTMSLLGKRKMDWTYPSEKQYCANRSCMTKFHQQYDASTSK